MLAFLNSVHFPPPAIRKSEGGTEVLEFDEENEDEDNERREPNEQDVREGVSATEYSS